MNGITERQKQVLAKIVQLINEFGFPPTRAELAKAMGFNSPNAAEVHLKTLAKKGLIVMTPGVSRGIRVIN